jgi:hypothetical protein
MVACDFVGYFIFPVLCDLLHVSIFLSFLSLLCHPFPLLHYQNTDLAVSFLVLLPATLLQVELKSVELLF